MKNYRALAKGNLTALVVSTAAAGYAAGSPSQIDWAGMGWVSAGTALCSASAAALNQIYEVETDRLMRRTAARPLPSGRMGRAHAAAFAAATGLAGVALLHQKTNTLTAGLGAANIFLYAGIYTPLKTVSVANTWVGAVVGAIPPLMGWAAATGGLDIGAAILGLGLYFWQLPHFMALAWISRKDYAGGGHRMLPLIDPSGKRVAAVALRNCLYLFPLGMLASWVGATSPYFAYESAFITAGLMLCAASFLAAPTTPNARVLFRASLLHLPVFMAAYIVHRRPNTNPDRLALVRDQLRLLGIDIGPLLERLFGWKETEAAAEAGALEADAEPAARGTSLFGWHMDADSISPPVSVLFAPQLGARRGVPDPSKHADGG